MRTVQMTLDDDLVEAVDQVFQNDLIPVVQLLREKPFARHWPAVIFPNNSNAEHRQGYERKPIIGDRIYGFESQNEACSDKSKTS